MLSDNFTVTGVDARQWLNLLSTLPLQGLKGRTLYILHQGGEILQAFHPERGRIPTPTLPITNPAEDAAKLLEEYGGLDETEAVVMVEQGLPHRLLAKIRETYNPEGDILSFLGAIRQAIQGEFGHGLTVAPAQAWKAGLLEVLGRAERLISIIPDDAVSLLAVFEGERVWTSLLAVKRDGRLHQPRPWSLPRWSSLTGERIIPNCWSGLDGASAG